MNFPFLRTAQTEFEKAEVKNREREVKWAATVSGNRTQVPGFECSGEEGRGSWVPGQTELK